MGGWFETLITVTPKVPAEWVKLVLTAPPDYQPHPDSGAVWLEERDRIAHYALPALAVAEGMPTGAVLTGKMETSAIVQISILTDLGSGGALIDSRPELSCGQGENFDRRFYRCLPEGTECERHPDPCGVLCYRAQHRAADLVEQFKRCKPGFAETLQAAAENQARLQPVVNAAPQPKAQPKPYTPQRAKWMVLRVDQNRKLAKLDAGHLPVNGHREPSGGVGRDHER